MPCAAAAIFSSESWAARTKLGPKKQVLGRIAGRRELGEHDQIGSDAACLGDVLEDLLPVAVEVAHNGVQLSQSESQGFRLTVTNLSLTGRNSAVEITFERRFRGPLTSANGGYACGRLAAFVDDADVEVTLRRPPPLERPLAVRPDRRRRRLARRRGDRRRSASGARRARCPQAGGTGRCGGCDGGARRRLEPGLPRVLRVWDARRGGRAGDPRRARHGPRASPCGALDANRARLRRSSGLRSTARARMRSVPKGGEERCLAA